MLSRVLALLVETTTTVNIRFRVKIKRENNYPDLRYYQ